MSQFGAHGARAMINKSGCALPPVRPADRPHPHFLEWHREHCSSYFSASGCACGPLDPGTSPG